jgi:hypothetical protein
MATAAEAASRLSSVSHLFDVGLAAGHRSGRAERPAAGRRGADRFDGGAGRRASIEMPSSMAGQMFGVGRATSSGPGPIPGATAPAVTADRGSRGSAVAIARVRETGPAGDGACAPAGRLRYPAGFEADRSRSLGAQSRHAVDAPPPRASSKPPKRASNNVLLAGVRFGPGATGRIVPIRSEVGTGRRRGGRRATRTDVRLLARRAPVPGAVGRGSRTGGPGGASVGGWTEQVGSPNRPSPRSGAPPAGPDRAGPTGPPRRRAAAHDRSTSSALSRSDSGGPPGRPRRPRRPGAGRSRGASCRDRERGPSRRGSAARLTGRCERTFPGGGGVAPASTRDPPTARDRTPVPTSANAPDAASTAENVRSPSLFRSTPETHRCPPCRRGRTHVRGLRRGTSGRSPELVETGRALGGRPRRLDRPRSQPSAGPDVLRPPIFMVRRALKPVQEAARHIWLCRASPSGHTVVDCLGTAQPCALAISLYTHRAADGRPGIWYIVPLCTLCNFSLLFTSNSIDE